MTDPTTLLALAERCEQAAGPDRELDQDISRIFLPADAENITRAREGLGGFYVYGWRYRVFTASGWDEEWREALHFTSRLDAAVKLYPVLPEVISSCPRKASAAALRARAAAHE
jgi:hypothetical protein